MKKATLLMCCILFAALLSLPKLSQSQGIASPGGFGASGKTLYGGFAGNITQPYLQASDLALTMGVGLGDPIRAVGVQLESSMLDITNQTLFTGGIKLHHVLRPGVSIAVGMDNLLTYGSGSDLSPTTSFGKSMYFVVSHAVGVKYPGTFIGRFTYSVGAGYGRFSRLTYMDLASKGRDNGTYAFGAIKFALSQHLNLHTEWSGTNLNAALSANSLLFKVPFSVMLGYMDLTNYSGDGARFLAGIGFSYNFKGMSGKQPENKKIQQILENQERQQLDAILKSAK